VSGFTIVVRYGNVVVLLRVDDRACMACKLGGLTCCGEGRFFLWNLDVSVGQAK
jgi:hypothetical protein